MTEAAIRKKLGTFLTNNPKSELRKTEILGEDTLAIVNPWGDAALALKLSVDNTDLLDALNDIVFPERLSAIYHRSTKELEILWTAYALPKTLEEVFGRSFTYRYKNKNYKCGFRQASKELMLVAKAISLVGPTDNSYRNITSFRSHSLDDRGRPIGPYGTPSCFWISGVKFSEDELITFLSGLNFYLSYYDNLSPLVIIHPPQIARGASGTLTRYRHGKFPETVLSKSVEADLLQFWSACQAGDPARRFLYAYRIIEHAAFFYVETAPRLAVRKVLMTPHALDDISGATDNVIAAVKLSKIDEYQRFEHLMIQSVDPALLWPVIEANLDQFSKIQKFDGGFDLPPLVAAKPNEPDFIASGIRNFCGLARKIRNALSHGREDKNATVITPTRNNYEKLRPWASLIALAAGEIILYEGS